MSSMSVHSMWNRLVQSSTRYQRLPRFDLRSRDLPNDFGRLTGPDVWAREDPAELKFYGKHAFGNRLDLALSVLRQRPVLVFDAWRAWRHGDAVSKDVKIHFLDRSLLLGEATRRMGKVSRISATAAASPRVSTCTLAGRGGV